ncbi:MAG: B12-binding domain-containing radical SAM protein, partial [Candidatus Latescibacterota bacterium]
KIGLTLPGFVRRSELIASLPSLGLLTLAAMTSNEFDVEYLEVPDVDAVDGLPGEYDVVAISSYTAQIKDAYRLADRYRQEGTRVILGGLHVTSVPREASEHADAIVMGEGEPSWPAVLNDVRHGDLKPVYDSGGHDFDLSKSPVPRYDLLDQKRYNRLTVQTQRGCPHRCEFCGASLQLCRTYKVKPVENVIAEVRRIKEIWPRPFIEFADDNTFVNKAHSKKLVRALSRENIRWFTETDISVADDEELLALMRDSGCAQVLIGLESPTRRALEGLETRSDWKIRRLDKYHRAIAKIQAHGISVNGCFILGLDGSGPESFDQVFEFVRDSGLFEVQITIQTPFPGTLLYDRL